MKKIVVVDDEESVLKILNEVLKEAPYEIFTAQSALEGLGLIEKHKPHLVITDHDMPEMSGLEMLKELRSKDNYVSIMFVSGKTDHEFVAEALNQGADDFVRKPFRVVELLARVGACLRKTDLHRELFSANQKLQELMDKDHLTGLFNMRNMYEKIDFEIKRINRYGGSLSVVMMDMDHFKAVNDGHDHLFGSWVLEEAAKIISANMREVDFAARYGGDEFLIVLSQSDVTGAGIFCERLRKAFEGHEFEKGGDKVKLTISQGLADIKSTDESLGSKDLVRSADRALYMSKESGRNCFTAFDSSGISQK